ncbi:hypothetical protein [Microbacterium murale]|uniref:Lipoprotein n=1 Tax=Microbacterium murale TaxID=1081040 RepID=A0ABQ1RSJ8_9MICO|nr:hypothetical protein [Microbacterium murale]GGD80727.1 hypothetical protein GCM10007269_24440 [Microbacterium murale]
MHRRMIAVLTIATVSVMPLAGCATAQPAPEPTTAETSAPSPDPTPTQETDEPDPEDPSTWLVSDEGIGPIETGGDFEATLSALPTSWMNDENCSWTAWWNAQDQSYNVNFARGTTTETDPIMVVSASAADPVTPGVGPRTEEGLGIGSTEDEILAQYPDAVEGTAPIGEGTWLSVQGDTAKIFFEFYTTSSEQANAVTVTTADQPPYEVCG